MRVQGWKVQEVFKGIRDQAERNANIAMDETVALAKQKCPVGTITREGEWSYGAVSFKPRTGKNKGQEVRFYGKRWMGRAPGDLKDTIRRVNKPGSGKIRVYAGTFKIWWAHFVERGTVRMAAKPFLRPAFAVVKQSILRIIKDGKGGEALEPRFVGEHEGFWESRAKNTGKGR